MIFKVINIQQLVKILLLSEIRLSLFGVFTIRLLN